MTHSAPKNPQTLTGVIVVTRKGVGYLKHPDREEDVEIAPEYVGVALSGDIVDVELAAPRPNIRQQGRVVRVAERARETFVGVVIRESDELLVRPDSQRIHTLFSIPEHAAAVGEKVVIKMEDWRDARERPRATVTDVIGASGEHDVEMRAIVIEHGFAPELPSTVEAEAAQIKAAPAITDADIRARRDMRTIPTCTIDPESAKDFDDALSVRFMDDGTIEVGVHIADVSHYVSRGSAIDQEAHERGTSVYLVDRTIPMLPEVLSNDICSLNPNEGKLAFSAVFVMNERGEVRERWFGETVIKSDRRFTYKEAQDIIDLPAAQAAGSEMHRELTTLHRLSRILRKERMDAGAIAFETDEVAFKLDENGVPIDVYVKPHYESNELIEEFMLLANREVARRMYELAKNSPARDAAFIYRVHDVPNPEKIDMLSTFVRAIGYEFNTTEDGTVSAREINRLFEQIEGTPEEDLIKVATIRTMAKAIYSTKNIGHFGLSFRYYTHFTSPIRRYPDLIVHRIFKRHLGGTYLEPDEVVNYERLALEASEREAEAVAAERDSIKYKQVEYMSTRVGDVFDARVVGVTEWGMFVEDTHSRAEGLVRFANMGDDFFELDREHYRIVGRRTKRTYALGDTMRVKLTKADLETRQLDFVLVA